MIYPSSLKLIITLLLFTLSQHALLAQVLSGKVTNPAGEALPYATLYIEGSSTGTNTNTEGLYELELSPGTYSVVFQYVGYKKTKKSIQIANNSLQLNIELSPETFQLKEVVVSADQEDPAYPIIRNAIANRKKHKEEIESYTCQVYMKGLQRLDERPSKLFGYTIPVDTGIIYLSESIAKLQVQQPNRVNETMISSKVSGNSSGFSFNQASQTLISFYDNLIKVDGLTERGFVSPIANNALFFYKYQLVGTLTENNLLVNKIKVIPRRKTDPVFEGYIYIVEDQWSLSCVDLILTKAHQIEFLDQVHLQQIFTPVEPDIWVMITQQFDFDINVWGFKGSGYFMVNYSDYTYELNEKYHQTLSIEVSDTITRKPTKKKRFVNRKSNNEVLKIKDDANERSDIYWLNNRPVPLTTIEQRDYNIKDSLAVFMKSKSYLDTLDKKTNQLSISKILYTGYKHQNSQRETYWRINPLINTLQYNTVEGVLINLGGDYTISQEERLRHQITPQIRYGFTSHDLYSQINYSWHYNSIKQSKLSLSGGKFVAQINGENPILPLVNTLETLLNKRNYMKLYEKRYLKISHESEVSNGIHLKTNLEYVQRSPLFNQTDYALFYQNSRSFSINNPRNVEKGHTAFERHNALILTARLTFRINQKYISGPNMKYNLGSKYPDLIINYRGGIAGLGSNTRYDLVELKIKDSFKLGLLGEGKYILGTGNILNDSNLNFLDYKHFKSNQSIYTGFELDQFQLLNYYSYSTTKHWLHAHYSHHFNGFIINKLPLIKKSKVQTVAAFHYLNTESLSNYFEFSIGLEHILKVGRLDYTLGVSEGKNYLHGIRFGLGF